MAYWPQVGFQATVETDSQNFLSKAGANWLNIVVTLRWSLWNGGETKARVEQARFAEYRAEALRKRADSAIHLEVLKAYYSPGPPRSESNLLPLLQRRPKRPTAFFRTGSRPV